MILRSSRLLRELGAGRSCACMKMSLGDPRIIEMCGLAGFSAIWLCNEHVGNTWLNLENQIRAAKLYDMDTIVRVEKTGYTDFIKPFEADATAIMVPHVSSAEEARRIVEMTRFHPLGRRAIDGGNVDGAYCQAPLADYIAHGNRERLLIFQIESPWALEKVEEIAAVPGFDVLLFGPGDFSHLLGKAGRVNDPEVLEARKRVAAAARAHHKHLMCPGMLASRAELEAEGWRIFNLGGDVLGLGRYFHECVERFDKASRKADTSARANTTPDVRAASRTR